VNGAGAGAIGGPNDDVTEDCEESLLERKVVVEVVQADTSSKDTKIIEKVVEQLSSKLTYSDVLFPITDFQDGILREHVKSIRFCFDDENNIKDQEKLELVRGLLTIRVFKLNVAGAEIEEICTEDGEEAVQAASHWILPNVDFQDLWENLIYETNIKNDLLRFVETSLLLADKQVNTNVISCNRVVLLHGPPGTGKTSLCKALAQKVCIRLGHRYTHGQLIEINSHSLFSKYFSESGKLVQKMFADIRDFIDDPKAFVCVLIDEVESLAAARNKSSSEPSDAVRVVNAVLTQLDALKHFPNVLILTTSNITGSIDLAFVDRADIKQHIGLPTQSAIYKIYETCIQELIRTKIIVMMGHNIKPVQLIKYMDTEEKSVSMELWKVSEESVGLSGRTLRKIPVLALARFCNIARQVEITKFLTALKKAIAKQRAERDELNSDD